MKVLSQNADRCDLFNPANVRNGWAPTSPISANLFLFTQGFACRQIAAFRLALGLKIPTLPKTAFSARLIDYEVFTIILCNHNNWCRDSVLKSVYLSRHLLN